MYELNLQSRIQISAVGLDYRGYQSLCRSKTGLRPGSTMSAVGGPCSASLERQGCSLSLHLYFFRVTKKLFKMANSRCGVTGIRNCPPVFLAPALFPYRQTPKFFSTSSAFSQRTTRKKHARHPNRGVSALRRTGLRHHVEMDRFPLPEPVLDPEKRSKVAVDEKHGLWAFFRLDKKALSTPEETAAFGSPRLSNII